MSSDQAQQIEAVGETFYDNFMQRAKQFGADTLRLIPELEGIAIVPSYLVPQDRLPFGMIMGRNGPLCQPAEIMHMAVQLHGCLQTQLQHAFDTMKEINAFMTEQRNTLANIQEQIDAKRAELQSLSGESPQTTDSSGDRTSPSDS